MPAAVMETIMVDHVSDSAVENTLPRNSSGTRRSNCETFSTELTATPARERAMKNRAAAKLRIWLKST